MLRVSLEDAVPATTNEDSQVETRGETITIRDFYGRVIETVGITARGDFDTSTHGVVSAADLGPYVLKITGHPAAPK